MKLLDKSAWFTKTSETGMPSVWAVSDVLVNGASSRAKSGLRFVVPGPALPFLTEPLAPLVGRLQG